MINHQEEDHHDRDRDDNNNSNNNSNQSSVIDDNDNWQDELYQSLSIYDGILKKDTIKELQLPENIFNLNRSLPVLIDDNDNNKSSSLSSSFGNDKQGNYWILRDLSRIENNDIKNFLQVMRDLKRDLIYLNGLELNNNNNGLEAIALDYLIQLKNKIQSLTDKIQFCENSLNEILTILLEMTNAIDFKIFSNFLLQEITNSNYQLAEIVQKIKSLKDEYIVNHQDKDQDNTIGGIEEGFNEGEDEEGNDSNGDNKIIFYDDAKISKRVEEQEMRREKLKQYQKMWLKLDMDKETKEWFADDCQIEGKANMYVELMKLGDAIPSERVAQFLISPRNVAYTLHLGFRKLENQEILLLSKLIFKNLYYCNKVQHLNLINCHLADYGIQKLMPHLKNLNNLETLNLQGNMITNYSMKNISDLIYPLKKLHTLYLDDNPLGASGIHTISRALRTASSLKHVSLSNTDMDDIGLKHLTRALTKYDLQAKKAEPEDDEIENHDRSNNMIKNVGSRYDSIRDLDALKNEEGITNNGYRDNRSYSNVDGNESSTARLFRKSFVFSPEETSRSSSSQKFTDNNNNNNNNLNKIVTTGDGGIFSTASDNDLSINISPGGGRRRRRETHISKKSITAAFVPTGTLLNSHARKNSHRFLGSTSPSRRSIFDKSISEVNEENLTRLMNSERQAYYHFRKFQCVIFFLGMYRARRKKKIHFPLLNLSHNRITSKGVDWILHLIKFNPSIYELDLSHNLIFDEGAERIANAIIDPFFPFSAKSLDLSYTGLTEKGLCILMDAVHTNQSIEHIKLDGNEINSTSLNWLASKSQLQEGLADDLCMYIDELEIDPEPLIIVNNNNNDNNKKKNKNSDGGGSSSSSNTNKFMMGSSNSNSLSTRKKVNNKYSTTQSSIHQTSYDML